MNLLRRLLPSEDIDALLGDITEESRQRSRLWYAAQIIAVLVVGSWRDIRRHPLLALRAVAIGIAAFVALVMLSTWLVVSRVGQLTTSIKNAWFRSLDYREFERFDTAVFFAAYLLLFYVALTGSGWIVGRVNRKHGIALVLPYAMLAGLFLRPALWHGDHYLLSGLWFGVAKSLAAVVSVLIGGYLATRRVDVGVKRARSAGPNAVGPGFSRPL